MGRNTIWYRLAAVLAVAASTLTPAVAAAAVAPPAGASSGPTPSWEVEQLDKLLAVSTDTVRIDDMVFTRAVVQSQRDRLAGDAGLPTTRSATAKVSLWPGGNVYYRFDAAVTTTQQQQFTDAVGEWAAFANLRFVLRTTEPNFITVRVNATDNNSYIGMSGGEQILNLHDWSRSTILHEVGHALGFVHEHQRADRDTYVTILTENIQAGHESDFVRFDTAANHGSYDFLSVMHYQANAWSVDPSSKNTIEPKPAYSQYLTEIGNQRDRPQSRLDRAGVAEVYGAPPTPPSAVVTSTKDSGPGTLRSAISYAFDRAAAGSATTVTFQVPASDPNFDGTVVTFRPTASLPALGDRTTLDGQTQTTFGGNTNANGPEVQINGANIVSGDATYGVRVRGANSTVRNLAVSGFTHGIQLRGAATTGNVVTGNYVGTNPAGTAAAANSYAGISLVEGAHNNTVGGTTADARNLVSGNGGYGVLLVVGGTDGNTVQGNYIGVDAAGSAALANTWDGVRLASGASSNVIGGTAPGAGNLISGNGQIGVGLSAAGTDQNRIEGNLVGTNAAGTAAIANGNTGVNIFNGPARNTVGGTTAAARNSISGNTGPGVALSGVQTTANTVAGNSIGLSSDGAQALANSRSGVSIFDGAHENTIGGTASGARNFLAGNNDYGVAIGGGGTSGNRVQGNTIGQNPAGAAVANGSGGVILYDGATSNEVGGSEDGAGNVIAGNTNAGVRVVDPASAGNAIRRNSISGNSRLGINLSTDPDGDWGVSANDPGDGDTGPNGLQNFPVLSSAGSGGTATVVEGTLNSTANATFRVELFSSPSADPSSYGEGATFLKATDVTTDGSGNGSFSVTFAPPATVGHVVTATATDSAGNTSEFSQAVTVAQSTVTPPKKAVAVADFDGDGDTDTAVFRPSTGVWFTASPPTSPVFGQDGDIPVPGDYDGDGNVDQAVFRPSNGVWYLNGSPAASIPFGISGDVPVPADYDGDGKTDIAVFRPSTNVWYIQSPASSVAFGADGDIPVPGDYNGDGKAELAVFRPSTGVWYLNGPPGASPRFGESGDIPVPGDYDGDGKTDIAVFRPSTNVWYIQSPAQSVAFGASGDRPQPGDYDGDGKTDIAVFRPSNTVWYVQTPASSAAFGATGDIPLSLPYAIGRVITGG